MRERRFYFMSSFLKQCRGYAICDDRCQRISLHDHRANLLDHRTCLHLRNTLCVSSITQGGQQEPFQQKANVYSA